ncbi:MAG: hypothetical protein G01um1014107_195 [Parcubacteria group bacterium Gr01-1014_107]|nr:MAG: hypothetical protein G01um1014107_195 [Parcubacteria group bacterium Gr01-1014_107]
MAEYKRQGSFGGGAGRGGFNRGGGGRRDFGSRSDFRGGGSGGRGEMFSATCASCHKPCEVPFRPMSGKPVYCNDCFRANKQSMGDYGRRDDRGGRERFPKRDFASSLPSNSQTDDRRLDVLKKQLDSIDAKLDKIMRVVGVERPLVSSTVKLSEKEVDKTPLKTIVLNAMGTDKNSKKKLAKKKLISKKK